MKKDFQKLNDKQKTKLESLSRKIEKIEQEIQNNRIDADSGAFLIIQARRRVGQILEA